MLAAQFCASAGVRIDQKERFYLQSRTALLYISCANPVDVTGQLVNLIGIREIPWQRGLGHSGHLPLVQQRVNVLRDAYVSAAGHKRPGVAAGLPVAQAEKQAEELSARIQKLLATE
jgi:hypothetical protein